MEKVSLPGLHFPTHFMAAGASGRGKGKGTALGGGEGYSAHSGGSERGLSGRERDSDEGGTVGFQAEKKGRGGEWESELQCSLSGR